jgi:light-regulated signal transduction histidine kinase (bacteriophytochrome)
MQALIRDLLTFSSAVHTEALESETADLSASFNAALLALKGQVEEIGAVIIAEPLPTVRGETSQMTHVFQNLLSNALKYRKADVSPRIEITTLLENECWTVCVRDNGIGFNPQYAERIFGLFKRLHRDEYPGTGLGLAICRRIVERYGGKIWAEGRSGEGATFYFSLPLTNHSPGADLDLPSSSTFI